MFLKFMGQKWRMGHGLCGLCLFSWYVLTSWVLAGTPRLPSANSLPPVVQINLEIAAEDLASLRLAPRKNVTAKLVSGTHTYARVSLHLKGSVGSFRAIDDKPSFTIDLGRDIPDQRFNGFKKIHLNNSVEDPAYVNEILGAEFFRAAGIPVPQISRALVLLNGRALGLYVLKEGFTPDFFATYFPSDQGTFYDLDWSHDIDQPMRPVFGPAWITNALYFSSLHAMSQNSDWDERWLLLRSAVDLDRFASFMALEVMLGHRDGYCLARNNFRMYREGGSGRLVFLPHGMDQLLGKSDLTWKPQMAGILAASVMETPDGRALYEARFKELFRQWFRLADLTNHVNALTQQLQPWIGAKDFLAVTQAAAEVNDRLIARYASLLDQMQQPPAQYLGFEGAEAKLLQWSPRDLPQDGVVDCLTNSVGISGFRIKLNKPGIGAWHQKIKLHPGHYRFEANGLAKDVEPLPYGKNQGACLRLAGQTNRSESLVGNCTGKLLNFEFEVEAEAVDKELLLELRAARGEFWIEASSLRLIQQP